MAGLADAEAAERPSAPVSDAWLSVTLRPLCAADPRSGIFSYILGGSQVLPSLSFRCHRPPCLSLTP